MGAQVSVAVIAPMQPEEFFDLLWEGVWEATFDVSYLGVHVQNLTTERCDLEGQRTILTRLLEAPVDAIAILPAHTRGLNDLLDAHTERGTPVITFFADAPESRRLAFVGPDPVRSGALAGELLAKLARGRGRILAFPGRPEEYHLAQRYRGFQDELKRHRAEEMAAARPGDPEHLEALLEQADGIYVGDEEDIARLTDSLERLGIAVPCVSFNNTRQVEAYLQRGVISAIIDENRYQQGYFAVQKAYEATLKRGEAGSVSGIRIPSVVLLSATAMESENADQLKKAFELLVRQRTQILRSFQEKLEAANAKLLSLSITDPLTGLLNRRRFEEVIEQETARALRYGSVSLLMIDLNLFKNINDEHGHQAGDEALKTVAQVLKNCCRRTDTCARLGGDEFAVILPQTDRQQASVVFDRILGQIAQTTVAIPGQTLRLSLSIGLATLPGDAETATELIAAADGAMYQAKHDWKGRRCPL